MATLDPALAREGWIAYSTPIWQQAGRSEDWIAQNIEDEWASSEADILRRYAAGEFAGVGYEPPVDEPIPVVIPTGVDYGPIQTAWADYSTPIWQEAGRNEDWITQNIMDEWASSEADITRRYHAGDFYGYGGPQPPTPPTPPPDPPTPPPDPPTPLPDPTPPPPPPTDGYTDGGGYGPGETHPSPWTDPYQFGEGTFPWSGAYYPEALGDLPEHYIPSFPQYRQYPYMPPTYAGTYYDGMEVPSTFYDPMGTPDLPTYGAEGDYPTYTPQGGYPTYQARGGYPVYSPYDSEQLGQLGGVLGGMLSGQGYGMPMEAEQWQTAMGRIDTASQQAQEELTRQSARGGRMDSGLYAQQQENIRQGTLQEKSTTAQQFAIQDILMNRQAQQAAIGPMMGLEQFYAGEAGMGYESAAQKWGAEATQALQQYGTEAQAWQALTGEGQFSYESNAAKWGAETAQQFESYRADLNKATTEYEMQAAQNQMLEAGQERAWRAAQEEATKAFNAAQQAGASRYEAEAQAWEVGRQEWSKIYEAVVMQSQQEFQWVAQRKAWSEQYKQVKFAADRSQPLNVGALLAEGLGAYLGGGGTWSAILGGLGNLLGIGGSKQQPTSVPPQTQYLGNVPTYLQ